MGAMNHKNQVQTLQISLHFNSYSIGLWIRSSGRAGATVCVLYNLKSVSHASSFLCSCISSSLCKPSKNMPRSSNVLDWWITPSQLLSRGENEAVHCRQAVRKCWGALAFTLWLIAAFVMGKSLKTTMTLRNILTSSSTGFFLCSTQV